MKILNLKNGIRDAAMMENTLEAACTSALANSTFTNYVNFLTEGVSIKGVKKKFLNIPHHAKFLELKAIVVVDMVKVEAAKEDFVVEDLVEAVAEKVVVTVIMALLLMSKGKPFI
eukprot:CAMPEP_0184870302 /NCGR_PEP_ID=MMETSP0580-20130426/37042_1 /TAXON_ID=1118495 /ORGANISM="Dactyliosolen fragilissimus" /LENGTH=114 /DNA_ID=CAMNT_0027372315 /DNA_START=490 /DNA_END=835 /DNA_ORIENTATION=-